MPALVINGLSVNYATAGNPGGRPIIFIHGASLSISMWEDQLSDPAFQRWKLIAFDLPGHGKSQRSSNPEKHYSLRGFGETLVEFIEKLELKEFALVGLSLGANIIGEAIPFIKHCKGIVLAAPVVINDQHPPEKILIPSAYGYVMAIPNPSELETNEYVKYSIGSLSEKYFDRAKKTFIATDPAYRSTIGQVIYNKDWSDEIGNLNRSKLRLCIVQGKKDPIVLPGYLDKIQWALWQDKIHYIAEGGHMINWDSPKDFNRLVSKYAEDVLA